MAASLDDLLSAMNNTNVLLGRMIQAIENAFPAVVTSTTATAGTATLPAAPQGFVSYTLPDSTVIKLPYYKP